MKVISSMLFFIMLISNQFSNHRTYEFSLGKQKYSIELPRGLEISNDNRAERAVKFTLKGKDILYLEKISSLHNHCEIIECWNIEGMDGIGKAYVLKCTLPASEESNKCWYQIAGSLALKGDKLHVYMNTEEKDIAASIGAFEEILKSIKLA
ncbi:hypothetical protein IAI10_08705 [Clostridium sp. 19966]|uniref:hypothetical protein n=1 Tax=Clostridium sp. 19966 TaxID=2768166 RepID=UPI0028E06874|nr:hypothetical protein [Clostridium sp. 19966]MDT8716736.1 hypothetical protein [Clostridium sp. 19966]